MQIHVVSAQFVASPSPALQHLVREVHFASPPAFAGFCARHWFLDRRALQGRYLIAGEENVERFVSDPVAHDAVLARMASTPGVGRLVVGPVEEVAQDPLDRPAFLLSTPRAGSTLLYELLSRAKGLWSIGRESQGVIEGLPQLHPATLGYQSHRLTASMADPDTAHVLRCAFLAQLTDHAGQRYLAIPKEQRPPQIRMLEKTPENALRIPFLNAVFPDSLYIYLTRDARQTISSMVEAWQHEGFLNIPDLPGWGPGGWHLLLPPGWQACIGRTRVEVATYQWAAASQAILDELEALPRDRWCVVDYQSLTSNPEATVHRLCEFIGIPFDGNLAGIVRRPLKPSATAIHYPSPSRWRYNPAFDESALAPYAALVRRIDELRHEMAEPTHVGRRSALVQYRCFLDEIGQPRADQEKADVNALAVEPDRAPVQDRGEPPLPARVVDPSFQFQLGVTIPLPLVQRARFRERFLPGYPIAWIEDPATAALQPFWIRHEDIWLMRRLVPGEVLPVPLSSYKQGLLAEAMILVSEAERERRREFGDRQAFEAAEQFAASNYCTLSGLFHPAQLQALGRYYRELIAAGAWRLGDAQVAGRYGWHNEMLARFFHHQLACYIGRVAGTPVKPSYAYVSAYQGGAVLERHLDREQCEFTVSLLVERSAEQGAADWPLYFDTPEATIELRQSVGEAVLFRGTRLPHYRPPLAEGQTYTVLLFHYVPADFRRTLY